MTIVYQWPPVGARSQSWSVLDPIAKSYSLVTNRRYATRFQDRRRVVRLSVGGVLFGGYMEALTRLLKGGECLVRLRSHPLVWRPSDFLGSEPLFWFSHDEPFNWRTSNERLQWFSGVIVDALPALFGGRAAVRLSNLPPNTEVVKVGEFITVYPEFASQAGSQTRIVLRSATSDASGVSIVLVDEPFSVTGRADVAGYETAVFEPMDIPRPDKEVGQEWYYDWSFREVFADEVGGFEEVDPW